ncbi:MAG: FecR domain-containing protein [Pedobacter sp.]|uniref:FecR family protein n=1 Tax=Pedobacter sp. TaxID=1411316 RepID=UPI0033948D66
MEEILIKYVIGEATAAEEEQVSGWLKENKSNVQQFEHFRLIWETSKTLQTESILDEELSWQEFKAIVNEAQADAKPDLPAGKLEKQKKPVRWMQMAAVWVLIAGAALVWFTQYYQAKAELITLQSFDTVKTDTLADGSIITLNKNSVAVYPEKFTGNTREMKLLSGEAFFNVAHNREQPFIVHINDAAVRVVGTSFNIRNNKTKAEVIVETGIVEVSRKKVTIRLRPTEKVDIDYGTGKFKKGITKDTFYNYYRTKEFVALKTPLWRVVEVLNEVYKVDIQIPDQVLANRKLTTTLRLGSLDPILEVIAIAFNAHIVHEGDKIIIQ